MLLLNDNYATPTSTTDTEVIAHSKLDFHAISANSQKIINVFARRTTLVHHVPQLWSMIGFTPPEETFVHFPVDLIKEEAIDAKDPSLLVRVDFQVTPNEAT